MYSKYIKHGEYMIVAFLDLLGFTKSIEYSDVSAMEKMYLFNNIIRTKIFDNKTYSIDDYKELYPEEKEFIQFVEKNSLSSIE